MNLNIKAKKSSICPCRLEAEIGIYDYLEDVDNINEIAKAIADEADPDYFVTEHNIEQLLDEIGREKAMEYFGLIEENEIAK